MESKIFHRRYSRANPNGRLHLSARRKKNRQKKYLEMYRESVKKGLLPIQDKDTNQPATLHTKGIDPSLPIERTETFNFPAMLSLQRRNTGELSDDPLCLDDHLTFDESATLPTQGSNPSFPTDPIHLKTFSTPATLMTQSRDTAELSDDHLCPDETFDSPVTESDEEHLPHFFDHHSEVPSPQKHFQLSGRRIVDIDYLLASIKAASQHASSDCSFLNMLPIAEKRSGLVSTITFKCSVCSVAKRMSTSDPKTSDSSLNINTAAVAGVIATGGRYSKLKEFASVMEIPFMTRETFKRHHALISGPKR